MRIDLTDASLYRADELDIQNNIAYCFGKNGTGKSTLTKLIRKQYEQQYDVRVFQGFESVVSNDEKLNAVVLGEENVAIQADIDAIQQEINTLEIANDDARKRITFTDGSDTDNLAVKKQAAYIDYDKSLKDLDNLAKKAASEIKNRKNPSVATTSYTKKKFTEDIPYAAALTEKEKKQYVDILMSEEKNPLYLRFPIFDIEELLNRTNELVETRIEEKILIPRLENDAPRQEFAQLGLKIHKKGEICAFCGNVITDEEYDNVQKFFSVDETKELKGKIESLIDELKGFKEAVKTIDIVSSDFYPEFTEEVTNLGKRYSDAKLDYMDFFDALLGALDNKLKSLFVPLERISYNKQLVKIRDFAARYEALRTENNKSDVSEKKKEAERLLRLDAVKTALDENNYVFKKEESDRRERVYNEAAEAVERKEEEIRENNKQIENYKRKIVDLQLQTSNEWILAKNINKKIRRYVDFELDLCEESEGNGYYRIKDRESKEVRPVTELSSGEKNIIAFLYFIEKLNDSPDLIRPKIIIFDDPMNSNDELLQGLIVHQLGEIIYKYGKLKDDKVLILTHNIDFYYSLVYFYSDEQYEKNSVFILEKNGNKTDIRQVTCRKENIKARYEQLWDSLAHDYSDDQVDAESLLNNMRKIVESYTLFNGYTPNDFCNAAPGLLKLLHLGSHASKDINSTSMGADKADVVSMLYDCFKAKDDLRHMKRYWRDIDSIVRG